MSEAGSTPATPPDPFAPTPTRVRTAAGDAVTVAVIGVGPRGLSVLERLCANATAEFADHRLHVHLVDPYLSKGGRVWRTDQSGHLLMNTVASQVTMFVDDTVDCAGPVVPGPDLYEWARFVVLTKQFGELPESVREEARSLGPDDYPTRAFYGRYLDWVLRHLVRTAPSNVTISRHPHLAVDLEEDDAGLQVVTLATGHRLAGLHSVVLTPGHSDLRLAGVEARSAAFARDHDLVYLPPGNPADTDLSAVRAGETVLLRGLGLNFFDYLALLTAGRGGGFARRDDGSAVYLPSGREPRLVAGSRRGIPHHARGENQKGPFGRHIPLFLTEERIGRLRNRARRGRPPRFQPDLWPWIDGEVRAVYYSTLLANRDGREAADRFLTAFRALVDGRAGETAQNALLDEHGVAAGERWDWQRIARPYRDERFEGPDAFRRWLLDHLRSDVREARSGNVRGPLKAAVDVLRDLRNEVRLVVDHGGLSGDSYRSDLEEWFTPLNAFLSIGPPLRRVEEMIALIEAGVLEVAGPDAVVEPSAERREWVMRSRSVPGSEFRARVLIEARLPETDVRRTVDPLVNSLLDKGNGVPYRMPVDGGGYYETGGLAVTQRPYLLVDRAGVPNPRRFAFGIPTEAVHWATAAGVRPGVASVILGDADAVARASLRCGAGDAGATRTATRTPNPTEPGGEDPCSLTPACCPPAGPTPASTGSSTTAPGCAPC
ncbi:FAD/NAD(P)-binding protein [Saccharothrix deserti]|uniref:FAD/NAD(P)-binding protein n=1 Tax=Saccharothrix deserti TaxID=2593674 RepID=UPI00131A8726|nr:FAD/NAD(P)-binding protein [Saccharothrix deserti]